jgi:hypothetical protein
VLVKFLPVAITPALWRRGAAARLLAGLLAVGIVLYAAYAIWDGAGWRVLGFLSGYGAEEGLASGAGLWPLAVLGHMTKLPAWLPPVYLATAAACLAALALWIMARPRPAPGSAADVIRFCGDASLLAVCLILAITPHYPWYYAWLALAATIRPSRIAIWLGCAPVLLYAARAGDVWLVPSLIFLPALAFAWLDLRRGPRPAFMAQGTL